MALPILICDDSSFAQKQIARALPADWAVTLFYAKDGAEGLTQIKNHSISVVFLDLTMPNMDGYQVLEALQSQTARPNVIVVSGDIQADAQRRVMALGALAFIKKPVDSAELNRVIDAHGLRNIKHSESQATQLDETTTDGFREIVNVAMGRAVEMLARLLDAFVVMPIPKVNVLEVSELRMMLEHVSAGEKIAAVCQGFIGNGMAGEALLIFNDTSITDIATLMHHTGDVDTAVQTELLMDISSIFIGAILKGLGDQLDSNFSQSHPTVLTLNGRAADLIRRGEGRWRRTLCVELGYSIETRKINSDLLLLITEDSLPRLQEILSYVIQ